MGKSPLGIEDANGVGIWSTGGPLRPSGTSPKWDMKITHENWIRFVVPFGGGRVGAEFDTIKSQHSHVLCRVKRSRSHARKSE